MSRCGDIDGDGDGGGGGGDDDGGCGVWDNECPIALRCIPRVTPAT